MTKFYFQLISFTLAIFCCSLGANGQCDAGELQTTMEITVEPGEVFNVTAINEVIPPAPGGYGWLLDNTFTGGTGFLNAAVVLFNQSPDSSFDNDLGGILSQNNLAPLRGRWVFRGVAYTDVANAAGTICSATADSLIVNFNFVSEDCEAGDLQTVGTVEVQDGETFDVEVINQVLPSQGQNVWTFDNTFTDGTGGPNAAISAFGLPTTATLDNDLAGLLSGNFLSPLEGTWVVKSNVFDVASNSFCSTTADSLIVIFGQATEACASGQLLTRGTEVLCGSESIIVEVIDFEAPGAGGFAYQFENSVTGGTGAANIDFPLIGVTGNDLIDAELGGVLAQNGLPPFEGTWVLKAISFTDITNIAGTICETAQDSLILVFSPEMTVTLDNPSNIEVQSGIVGGIAPFSYAWSNGETTQSATDLADGPLTLVVTDSAGCTSESTIDLTNTSVEDIPELVSYQLSPNPTNGLAQLEFVLETEQKMVISIRSIDGRVSDILVNETTAGGIFDLDLTNYIPGVYLLHISTAEGQYATRIVKQ